MNHLILTLQSKHVAFSIKYKNGVFASGSEPYSGSVAGAKMVCERIRKAVRHESCEILFD